MARERRLAGAERAVQLDEGSAERTMAGDRARGIGAGAFVGPCRVARF
jgi:hypothetical protein